jgi:6-phosphofructokinase 2
MTTTIVTLCVNPALDKSAHIDHVAPDRKLRCDRPRTDPGGGGVNVSRAIHQMGGSSLAVYAAGGPTGDLIEHLLDEEGVTQHRVTIAGTTRESITIFEDASDQQYRFSMPGADVTEDAWRRCLEAVFDQETQPDYLVVSGSTAPNLDDDAYAQVARRARELGIRVILDSSGEEFRRAVDAGVFLVKPNMRELGHLAGEEIHNEEHQIEVARGLVSSGKAEVVVVSLGAGGALLVTEDDHENVRAPTVNIKSKIGAGDTMVGGITMALAQGKSLRQAIYYGVAAGSAAVMTPATDLCRREDVERLYERIKPS